jgi:uncharacterized protein
MFGTCSPPRGKSWYAAVERSGAAFCRITQMGFLRLITNRRVMGRDVLTQKRAWEVYETVAQEWRVLFVAEPDNLETAWKSLTQARLVATNVWTDAYLAALAGLHGLTEVWFDRSFPKRDGTACCSPQA